ncbi:MAG: nucleotidyltransferase family protein [bacterium]|nr:nucleotidyltransferase family protein [bacterium]
MKIAAVIAEYNPFHNGHAYQLQRIKKDYGYDFVIVVMSGDFTQRGEPAIVDKHARAQMALLGGADLVIELPAYYACASAEYFATGAVSVLHGLGCVDALFFGSESEDTDASCPKPPALFMRAAEILLKEPAVYRDTLADSLRRGRGYAAARMEALTAAMRHNDMTMPPDAATQLDAATTKSVAAMPINTACGTSDGADKPDALSATLSQPNNTLGIEYCKALLRIQSSIQPFAIKRIGGGYHDTDTTDAYASAEAIRTHLLERTARDNAFLNDALQNDAFRNGTFHNDAFRNGTFHNDPLHNGTFHNGTFHNATFHDGILHNGALSPSFSPSDISAPAAESCRRKPPVSQTVRFAAPILSASVPQGTADLLTEFCQNRRLLAQNDFSDLVHYQLLLHASELERYADCTPELANRIRSLMPSLPGKPVTDMIDALKTRAYTYTRINRVLTHLLLDMTKDQLAVFTDQNVPVFLTHARILGFRREACGTLLSTVKKNARIPLITKPSDYRPAGAAAMLYETDLLASHIYQSIVSGKSGQPFRHELTRSPLMR